MKKAAQQRIMKKPLLVLAIIFFGIGVAIYTNAGYKEGNETMGADKPVTTTTPTAKPTAKPTATATNTNTATNTTTATPANPSFDMQTLLKNPEAIKKLLDNPAISSLMGSISTATEPQPNVVSPPMGK